MTKQTTDNLHWYQTKAFKIILFVLANLLSAFSHFYMPRWDYYMIWAVIILLPFALILSLTGASNKWILSLPVPVILLWIGVLAFNSDFSEPILLGLLGMLGGSVVLYFCLLFNNKAIFKIVSLTAFSVLAFLFVPRWSSNYRMSMGNVFDLAKYATQGVKQDSIYAFQYYRIDGRDSFKLKRTDKKILLDFWRLSCLPCIEELPNIYDLIEQNPYPDEYEIYSILLPDSRKDSLLDADIRRALKKSNPNFIFNPDPDAGKKIGIHALPQFILLDSSGQVLETGVASNYEHYDGNLNNVLKRWKITNSYPKK